MEYPLVTWEQLLALMPEMHPPPLLRAPLCPGPAHSFTYPPIQKSYQLLSTQAQAELRWLGKASLRG